MLNQILHYALTHADVLAAYLGAGGVLSAGLQVLLHKANIDSKKLAFTLIHLISLAGAFAGFYLDNLHVLPTYAGLLIAAQTVHRFVVSPYYINKVVPYLNFLSESAANQAQTTTEYAAPAPSPAAPSFSV